MGSLLFDKNIRYSEGNIQFDFERSLFSERSVDWIRRRAEQRRYFHVVVRTHPTRFYRFGYSDFWCSRSHVNEKEEGRLTAMYKEVTS